MFFHYAPFIHSLFHWISSATGEKTAILQTNDNEIYQVETIHSHARVFDPDTLGKRQY